MKLRHTSDYQAQRKAAYPSIEDQLDILYHEGIEAWREVIRSIKTAHPKPGAPKENS